MKCSVGKPMIVRRKVAGMERWYILSSNYMVAQARLAIFMLYHNYILSPVLTHISIMEYNLKKVQ
jgi:hypothetical protein